MQTECQVFTNHQTKPTDLGCEWASTIHIHHHFLLQRAAMLALQALY